MDKESAYKLIELNKKNYNAIAEKFSVTRNYIWPDLKNLSKYVN